MTITVSRKLLKPVLNRFLPLLVKKYLSRDRMYYYKDLNIKVLPGVFHPGMFFSTGIMLRFLDTLDLADKTLLEIGCGSGILSIYAAKKKAVVTATDISLTAVRNTTENAGLNKQSFKVIHSDLFENLAPALYDIIILNPPFYPKKPVQESDHAWYCGENLQFYQKLFSGLPAFSHHESSIYMVLSDEAPDNDIRELAAKAGFSSELIHSTTNFWETNNIFEFALQKGL